MGLLKRKLAICRRRGRKGNRCIPLSTYRLQLSHQFTFFHALEILPYLHDLGIDMVYLSPFFQTEVNTQNPYKIDSPDVVHPVLGGEEGFRAFTDRVNELNMKHMIDLVPNHMGASFENPWWYDLAKKGKLSKYASLFDVDWKTGNGKLVLPILDDASLVKIEGSELIVGEQRLPLREGSHVYPTEIALDCQAYKLVHWKETHKEINYRRFFDISELVCLKMGKKDWFERYHRTVFGWIREGRVHGLRVDHPDGIWEVGRYLKRLRKRCKKTYIVVEKILGVKEHLVSDWPVDGNVGYDALNLLNQLFVDHRNEKAFNQIYETFAGQQEPFDQLLLREKLQYTSSYLESEINASTKRLVRYANGYGYDLSHQEMKEGLLFWLSHIPIYRTYIPEKGQKFSKEDIDALTVATKKAPLTAKQRKFFSQEIYSVKLRPILLRLQQLMPAVFAKGFEDTTLYLYNRMVGLNDVGSFPQSFGISTAKFHQTCEQRGRDFPDSMITTSTHDTKRSLDVRMRIAALSEIPDQFGEMLEVWRGINGSLEDANTEYFFYQTLIGFWPSAPPSTAEEKELRKRLQGYMLKVVREAKRYTNWVEQNSEYENRLRLWIDNLLDSPAFWEQFYPLQEEVSKAGMYKSLSTLVLKMSMGGVPDFYQGEECWRYDLVDPDNRREVDFAHRSQLLREVQSEGMDLDKMMNTIEDDRLKMYVIHRGLKARSEFPKLFLEGTYEPIKKKRPDLVAFKRRFKGQELRVYCYRFFLNHQKQSIPVDSGFVDVFSGRESTPLPFSLQLLSDK